MTSTTPTARAESMAFIAALLPAMPGVVVKWQGVDTLDPPSGDTDWMRVEMTHDPAASGQASLAGESGKKRWGRRGTIMVQCFARLTAGSIDKATDMACAVRDAFQGRATDSGVWFRNCSIREVGADLSWYQVNATITFDYDEVK